MVSDSRIASLLVDAALVEAMIPWPCPSDFGPQGRYRLEEMISAQGRAIVYRAIDRKLSSEGFDAEVAIKVLAKGESIQDEALAARRIGHPNILRVYDRATTDDGYEYLVAEFVEGDTLAEAKLHGSATAAARLMVKVARGIQAAHTAGVFHCDLKPSNILLSRTGEPKIADFGLARLEYAEQGPARGNLAFMAPEQFRREEGALTPPADIYALGGLLYYLVTGRIPNGETTSEIKDNFARGIGPQRMECDPELSRICFRALSHDARDRHETAAAFADDLESWLRHEPIRWTNPGIRRRTSLWIRRNPKLFAVTCAGVVVAAGVGSYARYNEVRAIRLERETTRLELAATQTEREKEAKAREIATAEIERLKGLAQIQIRMFASSLFGSQPTDILTTVFWLQQLHGYTSLPVSDNQDLVQDHVDVLRAFWNDAHARGRDDHAETLLLGLSLGQALLAGRDLDGAESVLNETHQSWADRLPPEDLLLVSLQALSDCLAVLRTNESGAPLDTQTAELDLIEMRLEAAGVHGPIPRLVRRLRIEILDANGTP